MEATDRGDCFREAVVNASKQDTGFYEKEVVGECAGYSVYLLFSPLSVPGV